MSAESSSGVQISVVFLNYNYARFLSHAIDSALAQDHPAVQIVVVDDGSTDASAEVIAGYGDAVEAVWHRTNRGQGAAINSGFAAANGDVVWFLDADDALLPGALSTAARVFAEQPGLAKLHAPMAIVDRDGCSRGQLWPADPTILAEGDIGDQVIAHRNHSWVSMSGNAFAAEVLRKVLPLPAEEYTKAADSFLCEQVPLHGPIARSLEPLSAYRIHGANQFANTTVSPEWLRSKIRREKISHDALVAAGRAQGRVVPEDPTEALDVALTGYRLASLRLDPAGHPSIGARPDRRWALARHGLAAAWRVPGLPWRERTARSFWFAAAATAPHRLVRPLFDAWVPDSPSPPFWRRRRAAPAAGGTPLVGPAATAMGDGQREDEF